MSTQTFTDGNGVVWRQKANGPAVKVFDPSFTHERLSSEELASDGLYRATTVGLGIVAVAVLAGIVSLVV